MEGALRATGRAGIPLYKSRPFELKKRSVGGLSILPSLAAPWSPHLPGGMMSALRLAGLDSSEGGSNAESRGNFNQDSITKQDQASVRRGLGNAMDVGISLL